MGCYEFTGSLSVVWWCAYMIDWMLGFTCNVRCMDYKREKKQLETEREEQYVFKSLNCLRSQFFHGEVVPQINRI